MKQKVIVRSLVAAGIATALGLGGLQHFQPSAVHARTVEAAQTSTLPLTALPDFSRLVEQQGPAVVNISVSQNIKTGAAMPDMGLSPDDPMYEFFRRFQQGPQGPRGMQPQPDTQTRGIGSGFIVSADGLILTNAHVVQDAAEVTVKLTDRREYRAKVIGVDEASDVAVIKIDGKNLPVARLGKASDIKVGEWVVAIGSPYGFENTVTSGIVSAKSRALPGASVPYLQTDVAVNPGNSGGPLFNMKGEVIGINSQIYSRSGGYQGLSFAVPIETAVNVKDQLVQHGKVTRGRLGVTIQEVNQSLAGSFGLPKAGGALVSSVEDGSAAAKAGIKPGDVVLKLDGAEIGSSLDLSSRVAGMKPGSSAKLEVWRDGKPREIVVSVGEAPSAKTAAAAEKADLAGTRLGVAVRNLSAEEQKQASVQGGVLVEQVAGAAAKAGIRAGDIILAVNGKPVKNADELKAATKDARTTALLVKRNEARIFVPIELG